MSNGKVWCKDWTVLVDVQWNNLSFNSLLRFEMFEFELD